MKKIEIQNRKDMKVVVQVEGSDNNSGLVFIMHGLSGFKEQPHLEAMAQAFLENDHTVTRFDTTNTFGESDGKYEDATVTNYYEDLEDVVAWAQNQDWYKEPFCLVGHSMGGLCTALYTQNYPDKVKALAPIATVVSGQLMQGPAIAKKIFKKWEQTGWRETMSTDKKRLKRLPWSYAKNMMQYDLMPKVDRLTMPVLMIVGSKDYTTPKEQQQVLFDALSGVKELHIIKGAPHTFIKPKSISKVKKIFNNWIVSKL